MKKPHRILMAFLTLALISGCAEKGPILLENITYLATGETPTASRLTVGVSPLQDDRGRTNSVLGKRSIPEKLENDLVVQGTVSELATARLKDALKARGIAVKDVAWDLTAEGIKPEGADILIGGKITTLWVDAVSEPFKTTVKAAVAMRVTVADAAEKKIIRTLDISSKYERENVLFSLANVEDGLSEALSLALNQIFDDEELKKRLK